MGRRIPKSKRHKKLKNIGASAVLDKRANDAPKGYEQGVPRKLRELFEERPSVSRKLRSKPKTDLLEVRRRKYDDVQPGMMKPLKPLPEKLEQSAYETDFHFMHRLSLLHQEALDEARIETKFDCDLPVKSADSGLPETGHKVATAHKREKRKLRKEKLKQKKLKHKHMEEDDFAHLKDEVKFGEVAMEPPQLKMNFKGKLKHYTKPGEGPLLWKKLSSEVQKKLQNSERQGKLGVERERIMKLYD